MAEDFGFTAAVYEGWRTHQQLLGAALKALSDGQLALRAAPELRSIDEIARHMVGARARWFGDFVDAADKEFQAMRGWDRPGSPVRGAAELGHGLEHTWQGLRAAIAGWHAADWQQTWPGEDETEPEILTPQWIIWHLIEHDLHHSGEISLTLGAHGLEGLGL